MTCRCQQNTMAPAAPEPKPQPPATAREQRALQEAFVAGVQFGYRKYRPRGDGAILKTPTAEAKARYPIPTRTEPRELVLREITYKVLDGRLHHSYLGSDFNPTAVILPEDAGRIAELLDHPMHTFEVDE